MNALASSPSPSLVTTLHRAHVEELGRRYEPLFARFGVVKKDKAGLLLEVNLDVAHGRALMAAQRANRRTNKEIVPEYYVRALLMGFLGENGA